VDSNADVVVERAQGVVQVTFNRPSRRNALTRAMFRAVVAACTDCAASPADRALLLRGTAGHFSSGAELANDPEAPGPGREAALTYLREVAGAAEAVVALAVPTVAQVEGICFGAGLSLALSCDWVVASESARFCAVFARRGLSPDVGGSWLLARRVGVAQAKRLVFGAEELDAAEALAIGLCDELVPDAEVAPAAMARAAAWAAGPTLALGRAKAQLDHAAARTLAEAVEQEAVDQVANFATEDTREALAAFLERRPAHFEGR